MGRLPFLRRGGVLHRRWPWAAWLGLALASIAALAQWLYGRDRRAFMPGPLTHGHHQIEMRCDACHEPAGAVRRDACVSCHGEALKRSLDSHPMRKFADPRNADLLAVLDARECAACHAEHRPELTGAMGLTLPQDYCLHCHRDIAKERPDHAGMAFSTCQTAGCHNFHDNTALYEDFLSGHLDEPSLRPHPRVPAERTPPARTFPIGTWPGPGRGLRAADADAPAGSFDPSVAGDWERDAHARAGVNCTACHGAAWNPRPAWTSCRGCHAGEAASFLEGMHGMRLARDLPPMRPEWAQIPMKAEAAHREIGCAACHAAHGFDTRAAAVEACLRCHDDGHSRAYLASPHYRAWLLECQGGPAGSGVSCATCHLPRMKDPADSSHWLMAMHNQNANLRPNEKMIRSVCLDCHGLGLALDALADPRSVAANFPAAPGAHVASLDMVRARLSEYARRAGTPSP